MKTLIQFSKLAVVPFLMAIALVGCGKSSDANNNNGIYNNGYTMNQYGQCIQTSTGQPVQTQLCQTTGTGQYIWQNGQCLNISNYQPVDPSLCQNGGTGQGTGYTSQVCYGTFVYQSNGQQQIGQCNGANCRGYFLYTYPGMQPVLCQ